MAQALDNTLGAVRRVPATSWRVLPRGEQPLTGLEKHKLGENAAVSPLPTRGPRDGCANIGLRWDSPSPRGDAAGTGGNSTRSRSLRREPCHRLLPAPRQGCSAQRARLGGLGWDGTQQTPSARAPPPILIATSEDGLAKGSGGSSCRRCRTALGCTRHKAERPLEGESPQHHLRGTEGCVPAGTRQRGWPHGARTGRPLHGSRQGWAALAGSVHKARALQGKSARTSPFSPKPWPGEAGRGAGAGGGGLPAAVGTGPGSARAETAGTFDHSLLPD